MAEEDKGNPDWLNDFQNNQATSCKQTIYFKDSFQSTIRDFKSTYTSPRYGRRSIPGAKSVENSPKKSLFAENKKDVSRSNSARPALRGSNVPFNYSNTQCENIETLVSPLEDRLKKISLLGQTSTFSNGTTNYKKIALEEKNTLRLENSPNSLISVKSNPKDSFSSAEKYVIPFKNDKATPVDDIQISNTIFVVSNIQSDNFDFKNVLKSKKIDSTVLEHQFANKVSIKNPGIPDKDFIIPELPKGRKLVFNIKTTWGDKHYLGLNGIEIFNSSGEKIKTRSIEAVPPDINILPEYKKDPRVVENLLDNVYLTQDDMHMWLTPFTPNSNHYIFIEFCEVEELALLRIWNYNKSRIHCFRGAKDVEIKLDEVLIFVGEIARATGEILNSGNCLGDTILFTTDDFILDLVAKNDDYFNRIILSNIVDNQTSVEELRPMTGSNKDKAPFTCPNVQKSEEHASVLKDLSNHSSNENHLVALNSTIKEQSSEGDGLNFSLNYIKTLEFGKYDTQRESSENSFAQKTDTISPKKNVNVKIEGENNQHFCKDYQNESYTLYIPSASFTTADSLYETSMPTGYNFTIQIHSTWGDLYYVGLNGIQIFDENNQEIKVHPSCISADPESVNVLEGVSGDIRTPDKLIDGINDSNDGHHMWLAPVLPLTINRIDLSFSTPVTLSSLKLWNYTKTPCRGVREFGILVDGLLIYNGEVEQAIIRVEGSLAKIPCKTVNFSDSSRVQSTDSIINNKGGTIGGPHSPADQSLRPLTTMFHNS